MSYKRKTRPPVLLMPLSASNVHVVFDACIYKQPVATADFRVMRVFESRQPIAFSRNMINRMHVDILEMLMGASNVIYGTGIRTEYMLYDKAGKRWTENFDLVEKLVILGVAAGHIEAIQLQMAGDTWPVLRPLDKELIMEVR